MKKSMAVCAAFLVLAVVVPAPVVAAVNFNLGIKAGVSLANQAWSDDDGSEKSLIRPTFGVFAVINLNQNFAIQPELNYLTTGEWWSDPDGKHVLAFSYLHIPVLLKVRLTNQGKVVPVVFAGPALGILLSAKDAGVDVKRFFKSTDFGADFGAGAEMAASGMKFILDVRYYLGLTNTYSGMLFSMKNRSLIVTVGAIF